MNPVEIIVCERTSRWAAALRFEMASANMPHRIRELRHLSELDAELHERPTALVAVEVRRGNFGELLTWLPAARNRYSRARFIGLVDRSLAEQLYEIHDVLSEAGAQAISSSPRRLAGVVAIAARHSATAGKTDENASLVRQVWTSLPWQAAGSPVG